ncbi:AAA domain-containing protein [Nocardia huaxiensis]|uniref:AAA domain-containing protein n=1 Tax=Nocardia huaxiensis TaxID=2755382 RepID=UPI001E6153A5|nr:AAA domain-containing protein [Nocardia huaxiensis]UFS99600.1 AAA domain-containing protein [Nocardia huaxiensis]
MSRPVPIDQLLHAVRLEIDAALSDSRAGDSMPLRLAHGDGSTIFEFAVARKSPPHTKVLIRRAGSQQKWIPGSAVWLSDERVRVTLDSPAHDGLQTAELREDNTAPLRALERRIDTAHNTLDLDKAGWTLGQGRPVSGKREDAAKWVRGYAGLQLNAQQRAAIEFALGGELTFVWGPPGTGKTAVIGHIVEGCVRQGLRVLFVAPTNVAVDQALERICDLLREEPGFEFGLVQRAGEIELPSLMDRYGSAIDVDRLASRFDSDLSIQLAAAQISREGAQRRLENLEELGMLLRWQEIERELSEIRREIGEIGQPSGMFAQRRQRRLAELDNAIASLRSEQVNIKALLAHSDRLEPRRVPPQDRIDQRIDELNRELDGVEFEAVKSDLETALQAVVELTERRSKIRELLAQSCRALGTTVARTIQSARVMDEVDVVVVDEAAMVNLPSAWCVAGMARRRIVFAGDFRQLPAVTRASNERGLSADDRDHARLWMDRDVFHSAGLVGPDGVVRPDPRLVALTQQYRMRSAICELVNTIAYPDMPLTTGRIDSTSVSEDSLVASPLVLIDTSGAQQRLGTSNTGTPTANPVHAAIIHELVRALQYETVLPARYANEGRADSTLAVITPYRDQVQSLTASLNYRFGEKYNGMVDTVHRFQGSERPIVIIDTVAGASSKVGTFYESAGLSSSTCRLLNVAVSRARDHLVVVADLNFLREKLLPRGEARKMIDHLATYAYYIPVDQLVPIRSADELGRMPADERNRPAFFPHDEVPLAVDWDFKNARSSIDIYCAFLDTDAVNRWLPRLQPRIDAGVTVRIHTRNHQPDSRAGRLASRLRAAGCEMQQREQMHEKVVIVDEEILWHGSLNLLANRGPTDLMMRITDRGSCERVRKIIQRAQRDRSDDHKKAERRSLKPSTVAGDRRYLRGDVPMSDNDEIKRVARGRWDPKRGQWWVSIDVPIELVQKWL